MKNTKYDLEERTLSFARNIIRLCKNIPKNTINFQITAQLVRSAGSVGANYREANESLSKKDFVHRVKISRKESKESAYWLELLKENNVNTDEIDVFIKESNELRYILSAIIKNSM